MCAYEFGKPTSFSQNLSPPFDTSTDLKTVEIDVPELLISGLSEKENNYIAALLLHCVGKEAL